ncbi:MFS transporter [Micromonospora okii]|uniref:MFS transporter n=1 Tax=Micromonospora okii TaxID=1182970 RepID=UPI001E649EDB|nr:MFS transporter [Micromonospora okii]
MSAEPGRQTKWWSFAAERPNFLRLWSAQSLSVLGSQVSLIAFPLTALSVLEASASEVGILSALERAPFLLFGIFAGVLIDRWRSRRVLVITDWIRAVALALVPVLMLLDALTIEWMFAVAFVVGACTVFFDIAYQSALTSLVRPGELLTANRWLETSRSVANISGPGFAAVLLKVVSAPVAIAVDALSFVSSALFLHAIRAPDDKPPTAGDASIWRDLKTGLRFIFQTEFLRWNAILAASWNLLHNALLTIFFIYLARDLELSNTTIAVLVLVGSLGSFLGVLVVTRVNQWLGLGWCIVLSLCTGGVGGILLAASGGSSLLAIAVITLGYTLINAAEPLFNINVISIRQMITPTHLMARTAGSIRFVVWGTLPIGALVAGFMGDTLGGRTTMVVIGLGFLIPVVLALVSPFRRIRTVSDVGVDDGAHEAREGALGV